MNRLIVLSVVILLLLAAITTKDILGRLFGPKPGKPFSAIKKELVSEIALQDDQARQRIYKKSGKWFVTKEGFEYPADAERISGLIDSMIGFTEGDPVSSNKSRHKDLGIGKDLVSLSADGKTYTLYIGEQTGTTSNYVRVGDENNVYVTSGFDTAFTPEDYRDLSIRAVTSEDKVTTITLLNEGNEVLLTKDKDAWKANGAAAQREKVDFYINDVKTLRATDRVKNSEVSTDATPSLTVNIRESGKDTSVFFFPKDETTYFLRVGMNGPVYTIQAAYVESLKKTQADFLP